MAPVTRIAAIATSLLSCVHAHFTFVRLAHNGDWKEPMQYIRNKTAPFIEKVPLQGYSWNIPREYHFPTQPNDYAESARCGRDNMAHAAETEILKVKAGDSFEVVALGFEWKLMSDKNWYGCPDDQGFCNAPSNSGGYYNSINHAGPMIVHLSKVPAGRDVKTYNGDGNWLKIYTLGKGEADSPGGANWLPNTRTTRFKFTLPEQTPAGQYLLRSDLIFPTNTQVLNGVRILGYGQLYPTCAQIEVESRFSGDLPAGIKIPEAFCEGCPGMQIDITPNTTVKYMYPGGLLWDGVKLIDEVVPGE